jgi:hypothetical protein
MLYVVSIVFCLLAQSRRRSLAANDVEMQYDAQVPSQKMPVCSLRQD